MLDRSSIVKLHRKVRRTIAPYRRQPQGGVMTVGVAAIAERGGVLLCGADRMFTKGDVTYEPKDHQKIYTLGDKILVLLAGNMVAQAELATAFVQHFGGDNTRTVEEYARTYADLYEKRVQRIRERVVLGSRSLTMDSYLANATRMPKSWSRQIDQELSGFELPADQSVELIFVGKDNTGANIFVVQNSTVSCHNMTGYAVIGSGYTVADSQFVFARHSPNTNAARAVYTLYRAKRMAEQSLGVGNESDWYVIADAAAPLHEDLLKLLANLYKDEQGQEQRRFAEAEAQINADIAKRASQAIVPSSLTSSPAPNGQQQPSAQSATVEKG